MAISWLCCYILFSIAFSVTNFKIKDSDIRTSDTPIHHENKSWHWKKSWYKKISLSKMQSDRRCIVPTAVSYTHLDVYKRQPIMVFSLSIHLASNWTNLLVLAFNRILWPQSLQRTASVLDKDNLLEHSAQIYFKVAVLAWEVPAAAASKFVGIWNPSRDIVILVDFYSWVRSY